MLRLPRGACTIVVVNAIEVTPSERFHCPLVDVTKISIIGTIFREIYNSTLVRPSHHGVEDRTRGGNYVVLAEYHLSGKQIKTFALPGEMGNNKLQLTGMHFYHPLCRPCEGYSSDTPLHAQRIDGEVGSEGRNTVEGERDVGREKGGKLGPKGATEASEVDEVLPIGL